MTLEIHKAELQAVDRMSPVMRQVSQQAKQMGGDLESSAQRSTRAFDGFNVKLAAVGAALGTAAGVMADWTRAAAEDQAEQARLQQSIENTGRSYDSLSRSVEQAIAQGQKRAFTDTQVREALVRLTTATGDAQVALNALGLVEDLARSRGIDLGTAADLVGKAYNGNTAILARYGIQLDANATKEQALAAIQTKVAGQAQTYANSQAGWLDQQRIKWDELTESVGAHAGALSKILMLMPGLTAGYSALAGAFAGMGGAKAIPGLLAGGGQLAGVGALATIGYGYYQNDVGTTFANELANKIFLVMASLINAVVPGANPLDTQKYIDQMDKNKQWDQILALFGSPEAAAKALGIHGDVIPPGTVIAKDSGGRSYQVDENGYAIDPATGMKVYVGKPEQVPLMGGVEGPPTPTFAAPTDDQVYAAVVAAAAAGNMTVAQYLASQDVRYAAASANRSQGYQPGLLPGTVGNTQYGQFSQPLRPGDPGYVGPMVTSYRAINQYTPAKEGHFSGVTGGMNDIVPKDTGTGALIPPSSESIPIRDTGLSERNAAALGKEYAAYLGLANGVNIAASALQAFKATQDGIIAAEQPYAQQISEYSGQINAMSAAYDILNQRQQAGQTLTAEQVEFMNRYNEALERGTGGVEDATIAQGMLAQQYLLNMEKGDALNRTLADNAGAMGDLVRVIQDLILTMDGVPEEVRTRILLERQNEALGELQAYIGVLNGIPSVITTELRLTGGSTSATAGAALDLFLNGRALGGVIPGARHGRVISDYTMVGEDGPELIGPGGMVIPGGATRAMRRSRAGSPMISIQNLTVVSNDPMDMSRQISEYAIGSAR